MVRDQVSESGRFIAHSSTLCVNAARIYARECGDSIIRQEMFCVLNKFLPEIEEHFWAPGTTPGLGISVFNNTFEQKHCVSYQRFKDEYWSSLQSGLPANAGVSCRLAWTKIQSVIKGSLEAVEAGDKGLSLESYLKLGARHERLDLERRKLVHLICTQYHITRGAKCWDRADRVLSFVQHVAKLALADCPAAAKTGVAIKEYLFRHGGYVERIYVDEVQDCTPVDLLCLLIACGETTTCNQAVGVMWMFGRWRCRFDVFGRRYSATMCRWCRVPFHRGCIAPTL